MSNETAGVGAKAKPTLGEIKVVSLYESEKKIYARSVVGRFASMRWVMVFLTQFLFYGLAWLPWGDRQAVLFDLVSRKFYIFGLVFWPQEVLYLTFLLIVSAYALFFVTAIAGRVFCGYACPQTVYTEIFMWVENKFEGDRAARIRLDKAPWTANKLLRKGGKQFVWILIALWTGFTFVGYFTPIKSLAHEVMSFTLGEWELFWVLFYAFATWGNAGYMREQVCKYMCPYARFQSVMFDRDTLIVTYDEKRGEPRGARKKNLAAAAPTTPALGACVDCSLCVQVCPTGIDIRNGLQYECIGCSACIDVCDTVMDKLTMPRGLIRYSTETAMENNGGAEWIKQRLRRPRIVVYTVVLSLLVGGFATTLALRSSFKVDVIRDRRMMGREVEGQYIENIYKLVVMNTAEKSTDFDVKVEGLPGIMVAKGASVVGEAVSTSGSLLSIRLPIEQVKPGSYPIFLTVTAHNDPKRSVREKSVFLVPK